MKVTKASNKLVLSESQAVARIRDARLDIHDRWTTIGMQIKADVILGQPSNAYGAATIWLESAQANALIEETGAFTLPDLKKNFAVVEVREGIMTVKRGLAKDHPEVAKVLALEKRFLASPNLG